MDILYKILEVIFGFERFQSLVRRLGYILADKQINRLSVAAKTAEELSQEASVCPWCKRSVNMNFERGYGERWSYLGEADVIAGICRAASFKNHGYNQGWWNQALQMHSSGWLHPVLDEEAKLMEQYYWQQISSGKSNEYYHHSLFKT